MNLTFLRRYDGWGKASKKPRINRIYTTTYLAKNNSSSIRIRILIAYTSEETDLASHLAQLLRQYGGSLILIHIAKPPKVQSEAEL
jgi:hypothetical protein